MFMQQEHTVKPKQQGKISELCLDVVHAYQIPRNLDVRGILDSPKQTLPNVMTLLDSFPSCSTLIFKFQILKTGIFCRQK